MSRNLLFAVIGALVVAVAILGYQNYQKHKKPDGVHIDIGKNGLNIQGK